VAVHHIYDETAGHPALAAAMAERRPFWRAAMSGAYLELVSVAGKRAVAASRQEKPPTSHVDRVVNVGDITTMDFIATDCMIAGLVHYGLMRYLGGDSFQLIEHDKLAHSQTAMQLWWEAKKRRDTRNKAWRLEVLWRDGDQCRCCHVVMSQGRNNDTDPDGFTLDHRVPGVPAESVDDLAGVCRSCNGIRSDSEDADVVAPWQPVPERPFYTERTAKELHREGYTTDPLGKPMQRTGQAHKAPRVKILPRPTTLVDTAISDPESIGIPLPPQWAWSAHEGNKCRICGPRPTTLVDTASTASQTPQGVAESLRSDPDDVGIPLASNPSQNDLKTVANRQGLSPPKPSPARSNEALPGGGRHVGDGLGWSLGGVGSGGPGARRRRGRRAKPRSGSRKQSKGEHDGD